MGLPNLNTIAEMVGLVASLVAIWEFVRRSLLKKIRFACRSLLEKVPLPDSSKKALPKEPAFIQFLKFKFGQPVIIREGPFAGLKANFERPMMGGRVAILLDLLGRFTRLVLSESMISAL